MTNEQLGFGWADEPEQARPPARAMKIRERLGRLSDQAIHIGTSSWKYPGWLDQIYSPGRYETRGKFSEKKFNSECLTEYASVFPTVCGDFAFYRFPTEATWQRIFEQVPDRYRFSLKVPEDVTLERFPNLPRYGKRAGQDNPDFMNPSIVNDLLLARLEPYRDQLGVLIFEFGQIHQGPMAETDAFADVLGYMLSRLPTREFKFAVEVRNRRFLDEPADYLDCLRSHHVAHCFNSWTRMPPLDEQLKIPGVFTAEHTAARCLLRPGRAYQQAVDQFAPYERMQDPYPEGRAALQQLIEACLPEHRELFVFVNNRWEGSAIETIEELTKELL